MQLWDKNGAVDLFPTTLSSHLLDEKTLALLFLIHFVGDIHQPLHTCGKARGGNDFPIHFGNSRNQQETHVGFSQNMHGLWDYMILEKCINENYGASAGVFINAIVKELGKDISRLLSLSLSFLHIHTSSLYSRIRKVGKGKKRVGWLSIIYFHFYNRDQQACISLSTPLGYSSRSSQLWNSVG